jgi:nucleoside-diphosphate-sugar epimerase
MRGLQRQLSGIKIIFVSKVLVTGGMGFVGANLVRRLLQDGREVHCLVRKPEISWRLKDIAENLRFHVADLQDAANVRRIVRIVRPSHIFHLATAGVYRGKTAPDNELFGTNILGLINLLAAVKDIPYESFINTGSSSEYGTVDVPMREDMRMSPCTAYGISKFAATQYASFHAVQYNKPVVTLRLFSPYGPFDFEGRFIAHAIVTMLRNEAVHFGNPASVRDFVYIDDVVDAYMYTMKKVAIAGTVYNIGSGEEVAIKSIAEEIQRACGSQNTVTWGNPGVLRPGESLRWQADITKAKEELGWVPKTSLIAGLEKTIQWFRMNLPRYEL